MNRTIGAIMPAYNHGAYLAEAIDSVVHQVDRLVVVDDGSTDGTAAYLDDRVNTGGDITVIHQPNIGAAGAINEGAALMTDLEPDAGWLTWVSSDNVMDPKWTETLLANAAEDTGVLYSSWTAFPQTPRDGKEHRICNPHDPKWLGTRHACYYGPAFLIRADLWQEHRGAYAHDYDNWCRVEEACWAAGAKIVHVDISLCRYRMHQGQATKTRKPGARDAKKWFEETKRRRMAHGIRPPQ